MRIAIVDDTLLVAEGLRRIVEESGDHQVIWVAHNGVDGVDLCQKDTPDLVLMDLIMPVMEGVEATRLIMAGSPCPILIVSTSIKKYAPQVFSAMGFGALDAVNTPSINQDGSINGKEIFLSKINTIAKLTAEKCSIKPRPHSSRLAISSHAPSHSNNPLIAIGCSAGGPQALQEILNALPAGFSVPIIVIQHIDKLFSNDMSRWLNMHCALEVRIANDYDTPQSGIILLGGTNDHLVFNRAQQLEYTKHPTELVYRPSVDVFFQSVLKYWQGDVTAILLTGMGRDGSQGLLNCRERGFYTIAQDEATSAVYGMPKAAAKLNAAVDIMPLNQIAKKLLDLYYSAACEIKP
ncbi:MAG: chemotaxis response regulator protein-glutamate methylesterase [Candidatus Polarisedimenticolaceae bacterium]|nr:chemotaxis response regulator protein-glutamate methylesterase [Candidatus Polarisedimenticolaceae bacterium]